MTTTATKTSCFHCSGTGILPKFMHIANGMCFVCGGAGEVEATETKSVVAAGGKSPADRLREFYAAGVSRKGADRTDWLEGLHEPYDSFSTKAPIDVVRSCLSAVDATTASKARAAFATLGLSV